MRIEATLEQIKDSSDWAQVFADESDGNVYKIVHTVPPGSTVSDAPMTRDDIAEVLASVNGENDGPDWLGLFRLFDGRYLIASGGCDYTGWDCQTGNNLAVARTLEDAIQFGLDDLEQKRLGL